jgi:hypothetical protein
MVYQFLVKPDSSSWYWSLDENAGTTAGSVPDTRPAGFSASGVSWAAPGRVGGGAAALAGGGALTTSSPVLNTTHPSGFTVAAWVRLTDPGGARTVTAQDGVNTSMFGLGLRVDRDLDGDGVADPAWCMTLKPADSSTPGGTVACTTDYVVPGDWVNLVGIYDAVNGKIKLYVNGTAQLGGAYAEAGFTGAWSATGAFAIGRALSNATATDWWVGDLDEVYAAQGVWSDAEIDQHALA